MRNRVVIILAGGKQTRWGNCGTGHECKHLVEVPFTPDDPYSRTLPLLDRTVAMLNWWDHDARSNLGYGLDKTVCVRPGQLLGHAAWVESFWNDQCVNWGAAAVAAARGFVNRRIVVLLGDVYWTWERLKSFLESESYIAVATDDVDTFGVAFDCETLPVISHSLQSGGRKSGTFQKELTKRIGDGWGRVLCDDWTQDFDIDWEHTQFMAGLSKNNHFRNTPDQVRRRRALGMRPQKSGRGRRTR